MDSATAGNSLRRDERDFAAIFIRRAFAARSASKDEEMKNWVTKKTDEERLAAKAPESCVQTVKPIQSRPPGMAALLFQLQQTRGNRFTQQLLRSSVIQAKLAVSQPDDEYEREADDIADQVMRMPEGKIEAAGKDGDIKPQQGSSISSHEQGMRRNISRRRMVNRAGADEVEAGRTTARVMLGRKAFVGAMPSALIQRFGSEEHRRIGVGATKEVTDIRYGPGADDVLTYGEMIMLAGDYFTNLTEITQLATGQADADGRDQIAWARWWALDKSRGQGAKPPEEPKVKEETKKKVKDRYNTLAAENVTHFGAGGTARATYVNYHRTALGLAFSAGVSRDPSMWKRALTAEAFGHHFLTDMFSAGHVRTERINIKQTYAKKFPDSGSKIVNYMAAQMKRFLRFHRNIEYRKDWAGREDPKLGEQKFTEAGAVGELAPELAFAYKIRTLGGPAIDKFTLGDLVSLAYHNRDNEGLEVVSRVDDTGAKMVSWRAVGDEHLGLPQGRKTENMAVAAVKTSLADLAVARAEGEAAGPRSTSGLAEAKKAALAKVEPYKAENFIPEENAAKGNVTMIWEWGKFNIEMRKAVDATVKGEIASAISDAAKGKGGYEEEALNAFVAELRRDGIRAIEAAMGTPAGPTHP